MAFFQKLKDRLFKSSSKIEEGIDAIVDEAPAAAEPSAPAAAPAPLTAQPSATQQQPSTSQAATERPSLVGRLLGREEKGRVLDDAMLESLEELLI